MELPEFLTEWPFGEIVLTGHRVSLYHVIDAHQQGESLPALQEHFPTVAPDHLARVLDYYRAHWEEVNSYVADYRAKLEAQERAGRSLDIEELKRRWQALGRTVPDEWH